MMLRAEERISGKENLTIDTLSNINPIWAPLILIRLKNNICFLGAFAKLPKVTVSFVIPLCLSVCLSVSLFVRLEQLGSHWTDFDET